MKATFSALMGILTTTTIFTASNAAFAIEFLPSGEFQSSHGQALLTISRTSGMNFINNYGCIQGIDEAARELKLIELCYEASGNAGNLNQVNLEVQFRIQDRYTEKLKYDFVQWSKLLQALDRSTPSCPTKILVTNTADDVTIPVKVFSGCK